MFNSPDYTGTCLVFTAPHISPPVTLAQTSTPCRTMWERGTAQTCICCGMENVQASLPRWVYRASPAQLLQAKLLPLLWMFGTRMCHGENPSLRKQHRACGPFPSPGPGCLSLPGCSEAEHAGAGGSWLVWGEPSPPCRTLQAHAAPEGGAHARGVIV